MKHLAKLKPVFSHQRRYALVVSIVLFALLGALIIALTKASTSVVSIEPESHTKSGTLTIEENTSASKNSAVHFGPNQPRGNSSPGGTYADWFYPGTGLDSIEWTEVPVQDPAISLTNAGLLHYYAYTFSVTNATSAVGFGYAGFQTNGYINGQQRGRVINFSFWGSNGGKTSGPGIINSNNQESGGYQIMYPFNWTVGHRYAFQLKPGPSGTDSLGKWWGLTVKDLDTNATTFIAEERVQTSIGGLSSTQLKTQTGMFGEDLHWWRSLSGNTKYRCSDFQNSSMATINVTANNGTLLPNNFSSFTNSLQESVDPDNGYRTINCAVSNYTNANKNIQMNLGYWSPSAPNALNNL